MRSLLLCLLLLWDTTTPCFSCAAVTIARGNVVNADQEVIMIWDKETKTQHFIRQANFKTDAKDEVSLSPHLHARSWRNRITMRLIHSNKSLRLM